MLKYFIFLFWVVSPIFAQEVNCKLYSSSDAFSDPQELGNLMINKNQLSIKLNDGTMLSIMLKVKEVKTVFEETFNIEKRIYTKYESLNFGEVPLFQIEIENIIENGKIVTSLIHFNNQGSRLECY